ncbi:MAG TPA: hypothetical protein PLU17_12080 [Chitinophagaceae bacterium]|jgi:hypothetical protein|nr:hypothetical protein [Chitinophagaceae bacterium]
MGLSMKQFGLVSEIDYTNESSWKDKIFVTLDIDWAHDDVVRNVADFLSSNHIKATWFVTHQSPVLDELRNNPLFELGIHPNYNPLLLQHSTSKGANAKEVLENILQIVPEAKSVRSHSLTQHSALVDYYAEKGLVHELNVFIPIQEDIILKPYRHWTNIIQVPHVWEDDVNMRYGLDYFEMIEKVIDYTGITVLDFHPIHLFLNANAYEQYEEVKDFLQDYQRLETHINKDSFGTKNFLSLLVDKITS